MSLADFAVTSIACLACWLYGFSFGSLRRHTTDVVVNNRSERRYICPDCKEAVMMDVQGGGMICMGCKYEADS